MTPRQIGCTLIIATALAGCERPSKSPGPPAPAPQRTAQLAVDAQLPPPAELGPQRQQELMRTVFSGTDEPEETRPVRTPLTATALPDGRTALIVNSAHAEPSEATYGTLGVYMLKRNSTDWEVVERHENLAEMGSNGQVGTVKWVMLAPGRPGFMVSTGEIRHGNWQNRAVFFDLTSGVRLLGGFREAGGNDCTPTNGQCWEVESTIRFVDSEDKVAYRDIVVDFTDKSYTVVETVDGSLLKRIESNVAKRARYHYDGKEYVMKSGRNPVPSI